MGQEGHAHETGVSQDGERERVEGVYAGYAVDPGRQRAWSAGNPGNQAIRDELVAAVLPVLPDHGTLLDVGCGTGWWLAELLGHGIPSDRLAGVELLASRAAAARDRVPRVGIRVGDARTLPFADGAMSCVTLFTVLSSMGDDEGRRAALREARRVVARDGVVIVWEPRVPTGNGATARVPLCLVREELGPRLVVRSVTLCPPLARRVSARTYNRLLTVVLLRTHRLVVATV